MQNLGTKLVSTIFWTWLQFKLHPCSKVHIKYNIKLSFKFFLEFKVLQKVYDITEDWIYFIEYWDYLLKGEMNIFWYRFKNHSRLWIGACAAEKVIEKNKMEKEAYLLLKPLKNLLLPINKLKSMFK